MVIFPVRHHSPAAARQVERLIRERRPQAILVEGPSDASDLIEHLLDEGTVPPVAIYAYRAGGEVQAAFYPFCQYSPELVALRAGVAMGAHVQFCDLPAAVVLGWRDEAAQQQEEGYEERLDGQEASESRDAAFAGALAARAGFDGVEEFWEAAFEQELGSETPDGFLTVLADYGSRMRRLGIRARDVRDSRRERHMAAMARAVVTGGVPAEAVLLVCGAAHAAKVAAAFERSEGVPDLPPDAPAELALIPFSFPRLSEQSGYGAGNRAPWFYQQVWELQGDYRRATRRALIVVAQALRRHGHIASVAQCIDAYNLALAVAELRGKTAPGVDEVAEAAVACFSFGQPAFTLPALHQVLIGDAVGRITARVGRTPLQSEFYATAQRLGVPVVDSRRQVLLHLAVTREQEQSEFFHRLEVAGVPFAHRLASGLDARSRTSAREPLEQLGQVREKWELQWTPATDAQLIERTAWGATLVEVCERLLREGLERTLSVDEATVVLLRMALCGLTDLFSWALDQCESRAADSTSFPALARSTYHLDSLLDYRSARRLPADELAALASRLFTRAVLHLPVASICGDEAAREVAYALPPLYELVRRSRPPVADGSAFWTAVATVAEMTASHPELRGLALVLLELGGKLAQDELASRLRFWLSTGADAAANARLVAGLFSLHRGTLVRNRGLIGAVTDLLLALDVRELTPLLPVLRRSLGNLSRAERSYLAETLGVVLGLGAAEVARGLELSSEEEAQLRAADAIVAGVLEEWKTRYGIQ